MPKRNVRGKTACVIGLLFLSLLFTGCASFPAPKSDQDTLFVVPVVYLDSQTVPSRRINFGYRLTLENVQTGELKRITIDSGEHYHMFSRWDEGEYLLKEYSSIGFADNWTSKLHINQYLKIERGRVTVFPCKIVIVLLESSGQVYDTSIGVDFVELYEADYKRIREYLRTTYENYQLWES